VKDLRPTRPRIDRTVAQPLRLGCSCRGKRGALINLLRRCRTLRTADGAFSSGEIYMSMLMLMNYLKSITRKDEGQDLLEYALLVALIALVAIGAVGLAGQSVSTIFGRIATGLTNAS
jgi:pilus assembly protein Flp/PilA